MPEFENNHNQQIRLFWGEIFRFVGFDQPER
jgi:hypothetical protein